MKPMVIAPIIVLLGALPTLAAAQQQNSSVPCDVSHQLNCNVHTNNTGWNDFGNFGKILGFKANFPLVSLIMEVVYLFHGARFVVRVRHIWSDHANAL